MKTHLLSTVIAVAIGSSCLSMAKASTTNTPTFSRPYFISLNASGNHAFVVNSGNNTVSQCNVDVNSGAFSNCSNTGASRLNSPKDIVLNASGTRAFISKSTNGGVTACDVNATNGAFTNCSDITGTGMTSGVGVALNSSGNRIFFSNFGSNTVVRCNVATDTGVLSGCITTTAWTYSGPQGIALNSTGSLAYVANQSSNTVSQCTLDTSSNEANTVFSNCIDSGGTGFNRPTGIALNTSGNRAFITNDGNNTVTQCSVNATTGAFSNCSSAGSGFTVPTGIKLNASGTRAFVSNWSNNTVDRCDVNVDTGALSNCLNVLYNIGINSTTDEDSSNSAGHQIIIYKNGTQQREADIVNNGIDIPDFKVVLPANDENIKFSTNCPLTPSSFSAHASCKVFYTLPSGNNALFVKNISFQTGTKNIIDLRITNISYRINVISETGEDNEASGDYGHQITIYKGDGQQKEADVVNTSIDIPNFKLNLPVNDSNIQFSTTCPLVPATFLAHSRCKIFYTVSPNSQAAFNKDINLNTGSVTFSQLAVERSPVLFVNPNDNNTNLSKIADYSLQASSRTVNLKLQKLATANITKARFSLSDSLSNAHIALSGNCTDSNSALVSADSCQLTYTIPAATPSVTGYLIMTTNLGTAQLPVSIKGVDFYVSEGDNSSTPISAFTFVPGQSYTVHVVRLSGEPFQIDPLSLGELKDYLDTNTTTCKMNADNTTNCDLNFHIPIRMPVNIDRILTITSKGIPYHYPLIIQKIPTVSLTVDNRGGYSLWYKYPAYQGLNDDLGIVSSSTFTNPHSDTRQVLEGQQILLHANGGGGRYVCITVDHPNGHLRCTRATTNMVCYWTDGIGKSVWVRTAKDKHGQMVCPNWID